MNIFQIPKISDAGADMIIGVIDCSSSMEANWPWLAEHWNSYIPTDNCLTITFDTIANIVPDNILSSNINIHGGGGTNITSGFELMEKEIQKLPEKKSITVLFISDGADNRMTTLEKRMALLKGNEKSNHINFICLGVGSEFPTFVALRLREKYHNGDETLPAIFLIEYVTEKAYRIKFEALKKYFGFSQPRKVTPAVCLFPWREYTEAPHETAWILTDSDKLTIDGEAFNVQEYYLNLKGIHEIFRSWAQMMHLESLKEGEKIQMRATKTLQIMTGILEELKVNKGIDFLSNEEPKTIGKTFYDRIIFNRTKRDLTRIRWFYNDVKNISQGKQVAHESQFEAAKRIGMGTIVGIYQQKALSLKVTTIVEFAKIKEEFKELLKKFPVQERIYKNENLADSQKLKTFREVLRDKTLEKALDLCQTQFEFFESFELNGHPMRINRDRIDLEDPYEININFIDFSRILTAGDVLNSKEAYTIKLANGKEEVVNAVLPLFGEDDEDLLPLLNSRLFKLLMTYNCFLEADKIVDEAYIAVLAETLLAIVKSNENKNVKTSIVRKINFSSKFVSVDFPPSHYRTNANPLDLSSFLFKFKNNQVPKKRVTLGEAALKLVNYFEDGKIDIDLFQKRVRILIALLFYDFLKPNKNKVVSFFDIVLDKSLTKVYQKATLIQKVKQKFSEFYTKGDLRRNLIEEIKSALSTNTVGGVFNPLKIRQVMANKTQYEDLLQLGNLYGPWEPTNAQLEKIIVAAYAADSELALGNLTEQILQISRQNIDNCIKAKNQIPTNTLNKKSKKEEKGASEKWQQFYKQLVGPITQEFINYFKNIHREIYPFTESEFQSHCWSKKVQKNTITISNSSKLPANVCAAPQCAFFLKKESKDLRHHMSIWGNLMPRGFHNLVKENRKLNADNIYQMFFQRAGFEHIDKTDKLHPLVFGRSKEEILSYIQKLQITYDKILG